MKVKNLLLGSVLLASSLYANSLTQNQEENLVRAIMPSTEISKIERSQIQGFYKAFLPNGNILYVSPFNRAIFVGELYSANGVNITEQERAKWQENLNSKALSDLNYKELIQPAKKIDFNKGSKRYEFIIFTDLECGYCAKVESYFMQNDVSLYVNFYPLSFHKNAEKWSLEVLSSKDFKTAFKKVKETNAGLDIKISNNAKKELQAMKDLGDKLSINGTPRLYVLDKKEKKIVSIIEGANMPRIEEFILKDKNAK